MSTEQSKEDITRLYKTMLLIRRVEERISEIYHTDAIKSPVHLSIGQESIAVGACDALQDDDMVSNTYRCHATHIAKGGDLNRMMAELYGKKDGCAGGKAGSMHLVEFDSGIIGASAIVGSTIPVAAGYAWAMKQDAKKTGKQRVVLVLFGDGSTEEGAFSETINFAKLHNLPMVFLCENNGLAIHNPIERRWANLDIRKRIETYGIKTSYVADGDVFAVKEVIAEAIAAARKGDGPRFVECKTYRWKEHVGPTEDLNEDYRDMEEYKKWKDNDQIAHLAGMLGDDEVSVIDDEVEEMIRAAQEFAENSPYPEPEELMKNVYAG
jgi:pyruvate dehydrogenase E1 component alpha subunit